MSVTHLSDFSDRVSPMLVKELRQGMRAKAFTALFLGLQIFLAVMLLSASAASSDQVGSTISGIIFSFFAIAVLVVQPLRGTGALSSEVKGNTIDMMVLTRLSAWRIVFGKWVAIISQSALLLSTIIPYLILRYFLGGMNLIGEVVLLMMIFLTSMALTAVTVGLSGCSSVIIRSLLPIFGIPVLMIMGLQAMFFIRVGGGSVGFLDAFSLATTESRVGVAAYAFAITYLGAYMLSLGASLIAPAAENHALPRRLIAFVLLILICLAGFHPQVELWFVMMMTLIVATPATISALTDSAPYVSTITSSFARFGPPGRLIGWLLHPTWPSGLLAGLLIAATGLAVVVIHGYLDNGGYGRMDTDESIAILAVFGGFLFPAVWQVFFFRGEGQRLAHYLLLMVGSGVLCLVLTGLADSMNNGWFLWFFAWHPLAFLAMLEESAVPEPVILGAVVIVDLILAGILITRALIDIRKCRIHSASDET